MIFVTAISFVWLLSPNATIEAYLITLLMGALGDAYLRFTLYTGAVHKQHMRNSYANPFL